MKDLNSLEDHPCLETQPEHKMLSQILTRLDKWIEDRPKDKYWEPDETLLKTEKGVRLVAEKTWRVYELLLITQGVSSGQGVVSVEEARREIPKVCDEIAADFKKLSTETRMPLEQIGLVYAGLGTQFRGLDNVRNLREQEIIDFASRLEVMPFRRISEIVRDLADTLLITPLQFQQSDTEYLMQCVWLRNISNWARGGKQPALDRVNSLFEWTVCNIDLQPEEVDVRSPLWGMATQEPWQTLLLGAGTQWDRAWVFIELLRQQRIDACLLGVPSAGNSEIMLPWAVGVLIEGEIYIFLPGLGIPLPGPKEPEISEDGGEIHFPEIATLSQLVADKSLLTRYKTIESYFEFDPELLGKSVAMLLASPWSSSQRMAILEQELVGQDKKMVLYSSFGDQSKRFLESPHIASTTHWGAPLLIEFIDSIIGERRIQLRILNLTVMVDEKKRLIPGFLMGKDYPLWSGRILYFKNFDSDERNASWTLSQARFSDRRLGEMQLPPEMESLLVFAKNLAGFWLGVIAYEKGNYQSALHHFEENRRILGNELSPWIGSMQYLQGRIYEKQGEYEKAIDAYLKYGELANAPGNSLRVELLRSLLDLPEPKSNDPADQEVGTLQEPDTNTQGEPVEPENVTGPSDETVTETPAISEISHESSAEAPPVAEEEAPKEPETETTNKDGEKTGEPLEELRV